jgi:hypothetical protein
MISLLFGDYLFIIYICCMDFVFSNHAEEQMLRRGLSRELVLQAILSPDSIVIDEIDNDISVYQLIVVENEQTFLYRIFMNTIKNPMVVITLYRTTKIRKYHESKI